MEILIAKHAGFCEGVERAFRIALETSREGTSVFVLGNLVHNKQVVEQLANARIQTIKSLDQIPANSSGILLISAHGVPPEIYEQATSLGLKTIDTTCPWVKKAQKIAKEFADEGRFVIIVGDKGHPEVKSLVGWSYNRGVVIENLADLAKMNLTPETKIGILAQTTQAEEHYKNIVAAVKKLATDIKEINTICGATTKRQNAAMEIARNVDLMLVVGDLMSANTKRLAELCSETGTETHQIQSVSELEPSWLKDKKKVGLSAGASTPEWVINEVIAKLKSV